MSDFYYEDCGKDRDIVSVVLSGDFQTLHCDYLLDCVAHQIDAGAKKLIIDCRDLTSISSMGLGILVRVHSRMKKNGGDVKIAGLQGVVASTFTLVGLDKLIQMYPTVDDAIAAHGG
jgi:anti-sigma B factor antagonist